MQTGFKFIEQYQNMSKDMEGESNGIASNFDQQVPRYEYCSVDSDMTQRIKYEEVEPQPDLFSMVESIINNDEINNSAITNAASIKSCANFCFNKNTSTGAMNSHNQIKMNTTSTVISSNLPSFLTPSLSPLSTTTISPLSTCSTTVRNMSSSPIFSNTNNSDATETNYTRVPNDNFLIDSDCKLLHLGDSPEYTDLDTQQVSLYDDYESIHSFNNTEAMPDETRRLEEAALLMRDTIYNDCDDLNVPYDPLSWTPENVTKWVSWVCKRNNVPDVSSLLQRVDGPTLCSLNSDTFSIFCGNSGVKISNELELWKAANSCFPNQEYASDNSSDVSGLSSQNLNSFMESSQTFNWTPCVSPALSSCSRSSSSTLSTQSDHSDDESIYGSQISPSSDSVKFTSSHCYNKTFTKTPSGRGHKQTIHLWQFLQELLLSKDNNFSDCIRWLDHKTGVFKIEDSKKVATLWGARKNRPAMNYDKLSRSVRQYYKKGIIKKTEQSKRLVYQFCAGYL